MNELEDFVNKYRPRKIEVREVIQTYSLLAPFLPSLN